MTPPGGVKISISSSYADRTQIATGGHSALFFSLSRTSPVSMTATVTTVCSAMAPKPAWTISATLEPIPVRDSNVMKTLTSVWQLLFSKMISSPVMPRAGICMPPVALPVQGTG
ncbi:MAG: hypothetical protein ACFFCW_24190 [Candidatus Hodarchaeota archaeon]